MKKTTKKQKTVLVLRTVDKDRKSYGGFQWPAKGPVKCPDWNPAAHCGNGLHGWLRGEGDASVSNNPLNSDKTLWQVVEVVEKEIVQLGGKVKFPRGKVLYTGARDVATKMIADACPGAAVIGGIVTAGNSGTATAGNYGKATAGYGGTATAGDGGTATAGNYGKATAGNSGTATAGNYGKATAGNYGKATAGNYGKATAGDNGTATAGNYGKATAGNYGKATAGYGGTATAGDGGTATAGNSGTIILAFWDPKAGRYRKVIGYPGEDGIKANKAYRLDASGKLVLA